MIIGIGTDIVEVPRILKSIENEAFKLKVFSGNEIAYCETKVNKAENYAVRFAAKEAFLKALGTGLRGDIVLNEIEVSNDDLGKPSINLIGKSGQIITDKKIKTTHLSLSHTKEMALAMVVLED
jgi:holo-[acyl-carrier protein] synthase